MSAYYYIINYFIIILFNASKTRNSSMSNKQQQQQSFGILAISRNHPTGPRVKHCPSAACAADPPGSALHRTTAVVSLNASESIHAQRTDVEGRGEAEPALGAAEQATGETEEVKGSSTAAAGKRKRGVSAYRSGCCGTLLYTSKRPQKLEELPEGTTLIVKDWRKKDLVRKEDGAPFTTYDLIDISGNIWFGTSAFNKWREEVQDGTSPELDRSKYYVGIFKDNEGRYSIMQVNKPRRSSTKKAKSSTSEQVTDNEDEELL